MKRIICITLLVSLFFTLFSCTKDLPSASSVAEVINRELSLGKVYSSLKSEGEDGYVTDELREALFSSSLLPLEFAVVLDTQVSARGEVGIFYSDGIATVPDCIESARKRLDLLSSFSQRESLVLRYGRAVVYLSFEDCERARELIDGVFS